MAADLEIARRDRILRRHTSESRKRWITKRKLFSDRAKALDIEAEVYYLEVSKEVRKERVAKWNAEKDPDVYVFDVTDEMFNFMELKFEPPDDSELKNGLRLGAR